MTMSSTGQFGRTVLSFWGNSVKGIPSLGIVFKFAYGQFLRWLWQDNDTRSSSLDFPMFKKKYIYSSQDGGVLSIRITLCAAMHTRRVGTAKSCPLVGSTRDSGEERERSPECGHVHLS